MSRLKDKLQSLQDRGEKAMGLFLTNGFPDPQSTLPVLQVIDEGGADFIELGMPFSDPLAEGLPVQRSSARALKHGVRMADAFRTAEAFRRTSETPLLLMGYINPVYSYGVGSFCRDARAAGVDGLILPDVPLEESAIVAGAAKEHGLDLILLMAPNTPDDRVREIDRQGSGFVYAVAITGLTGTDIGSLAQVEHYLTHAKSLMKHNPLLVGFGIKTHEDAMRLSRNADGFIVGSALINLVEKLWDDPSLPLEQRLTEIRHFTAELKYGTPAPLE
jgi:tryptophan synthase alpha chain